MEDIIENHFNRGKEKIILLDKFKYKKLLITLTKEMSSLYPYWVKIDKRYLSGECECFSTLFFAKRYFNKLKRKWKN